MDFDSALAMAAPNVVGMLRLAFDVAMIFAPTVGYIAQVTKINSTRNAEGYAPLVSLVLLTCNVLRVMYWVGEQFAVALLFQSIVMIGVQLYLVVTVLKVHLAKRLTSPPRGQQQQWDASSFSPSSALLQMTPREFLTKFGLFAAGAASFCLVAFAASTSAVAAVAFLSLGIEATLVIPQIHLNYVRGSTEGLTPVLVLTWCVGDVVKMVYFLSTAAPTPFVVCGSVQLFCDALVILQVFLYRGIYSAELQAERTGDTGSPIDLDGTHSHRV